MTPSASIWRSEFIEYPDDSRTLFLPVETLVAAFG
jgi:hypothetical protein